MNFERLYRYKNENKIYCQTKILKRMRNTEYLSKEQRLKDYNTVANFLMSGDSKDVKVFAEQLNWQTFTIHCYEFMNIDFIRKYKDYIDWGYVCCTQTLSDEFRAEFKEYLEEVE